MIISFSLNKDLLLYYFIIHSDFYRYLVNLTAMYIQIFHTFSWELCLSSPLNLVIIEQLNIFWNCRNASISFINHK